MIHEKCYLKAWHPGSHLGINFDLTPVFSAQYVVRLTHCILYLNTDDPCILFLVKIEQFFAHSILSVNQGLLPSEKK